MARKQSRIEDEAEAVEAPTNEQQETRLEGVAMLPEGVLRILVLMPDGRKVEHVVRVELDGTVRVHEAPPPAPPVQDPNPISGT